MNGFYKTETELVPTTKYYTFTQDKVKNTIIEKNITELYVSSWSNENPIYYLQNVNEEGLEYKSDTWADKKFKKISWDDFYKRIIKPYQTPTIYGGGLTYK